MYMHIRTFNHIIVKASKHAVAKHRFTKGWKEHETKNYHNPKTMCTKQRCTVCKVCCTQIKKLLRKQELLTTVKFLVK